MRQTEESKQFFFAKKNQKTLVYKALALPRRIRQMDKSFCFFFQKEVLSFEALHCGSARAARSLRCSHAICTTSCVWVSACKARIGLAGRAEWLAPHRMAMIVPEPACSCAIARAILRVIQSCMADPVLVEARLQVERCRRLLRSTAEQRSSDAGLAAATRMVIDRSWGLIARLPARPRYHADQLFPTGPVPSGPVPAGPIRSASTLVNRNVFLASGKTSMRLDPEYWHAIHDICDREGIAVGAMIETAVATYRHHGGRTCAVRSFVLNYFRAHATEAGHAAAGHGALG
jgi:predicted DNA-binding ribbon-helix-helix protein